MGPFVVNTTRQSQASVVQEDFFDDDDDDDANSVFAVLDTWTRVLLALYILVFLVGTVANVLLIVGMCKKTGSGLLMTSKSNVVINLCVADLLLSVVCVPATALTILFKTWDWGLVLCKSSVYVKYCTVAGSTFSFMMLSLDRYVGFKKPQMLTKHDRRRLAVAMVSVVWSVALLLPVPLIFTWRTEIHAKLRFCVEHWPHEALEITYKLLLVMGIYIIPSVVVTVCHLDMGWSMRAEEKQNEPQLQIELDEFTPTRPAEKVIIIGSHPSMVSDGRSLHRVIPYEVGSGSNGGQRKTSAVRRDRPKKAAKKARRDIKRANRKLRLRQSTGLMRDPCRTGSRQSMQARRRAATLLVILVVVFLICWVPYVVCFLCHLFYTSSCFVPPRILPFALLLGHAHSAINPVLYWVLNRHSISLRPEQPRWKRLFKCRCRPCNPMRLFRRSSSTTNDTQLGPFHPRFVPPVQRRPANCQYYQDSSIFRI